ncbi:MAG TPA: type II secretion system secretin GspD [Myxococcota bacterium]|jgi:general secretion pathway protein D|nr:type II secretion system secretin GspD [Myxococcota bacterium]
MRFSAASRPLAAGTRARAAAATAALRPAATALALLALGAGLALGPGRAGAADATATAKPVPAPRPDATTLKGKVPAGLGAEALKGAALGKLKPGVPGPPVAGAPGAAPATPAPAAGSAAAPPGAAVIRPGTDVKDAAGAGPGAGAPGSTGPGFGDATFSKDPDELSCDKEYRKKKSKPFFDKAAIEDVVKFVAKWSCKNFIVSEKIKKGTISIYTSEMVTADAFYVAFESALKVNGLAIEPTGKYLKIVETKELLAPPKEGALATTDHVVTRLIPLKHVDGSELTSILNTLKSPTGDLQYYPLANTVIVTDTEGAVKRLETIISRLDEPGSTDELFLVKIEHALASEIAALLVSIFDVSTATGPGAKAVRPKPKPKVPAATDIATPAAPVPTATTTSPGASPADITLTKVIADDRTNQLILKTTRRNFDRILPLILKLDIDLRGGDARIHVHYLENAKAEELSATLASLTTGVRPGAPGVPKAPGTPAAGTPGAPGTAAASLFDGDVKISPDPPTNALVIVASAKDYESLAGIIGMLDIPRRQVLVEVVILEVSLDKMLELGFVFHGGTNIGTSADPTILLGATELGGMQSIILDPTALMGLAALLRGPPIPGSESLLPAGTTGGTAGIPAFGALLRALQTDSDVNILSTPNILATDNIEAEITVGANIPVQSGFTLPAAAGAGFTANPLVSVQRQDIGLTLKLTPSINESDYVSIDIETKITALQSIDPTTGPTLSNRSLKTTVIVPDQQTVVIGGLVEDRITITEDKVPVLGDIPILGYLFKHSVSRKTKTNLIVFMTPYIIKDAKSDFRRIFMEKVAERKAYLDSFGRGEFGGLGAHTDYSRSVGGFGSIDKTIASAEKTTLEMRMEKERLERKSIIGPGGMVPLGPVPDEGDKAAPESGPGAVPESSPTGATPSGIDTPDPGPAPPPPKAGATAAPPTAAAKGKHAD